VKFVAGLVLSERSFKEILSRPGKRLHHQRSSRHAMVPLSRDPSKAKDPFGISVLGDRATPAPSAARSSFGT
jgi:hypothetical protein